MATKLKKRGPKKGWRARKEAEMLMNQAKAELFAPLPSAPKPLDQILDDLESYFTNSINEARERVKEIRSRIGNL
jgi:hypothetical protein